MSDGVRFMPHPDDPPPGSSPKPEPKPTTEDVEVDVASILANMPTRIEGGTDQDGFGHWALGTGGLAALLMLIQLLAGGVPMFIPILIALASFYLGARGLAAARQGLASNAWMSVLGIVAGAIALVAVLLYFFVIVAVVAAIVDGPTGG